MSKMLAGCVAALALMVGSAAAQEGGADKGTGTGRGTETRTSDPGFNYGWLGLLGLAGLAGLMPRRNPALDARATSGPLSSR